MLPSKLNTQPAEKSIDFFSELSKIIKSTAPTAPTTPTAPTSDSDINAPEPSNLIISTSSSSSYDNICLISKEILHPNHITLVCNHKFNYIPIYKEVLYQKTKFNTLYEVTKLNYNQIKCPYCRTITNKLLPFIPYPCVKLAKNIHSSDNNCIPVAKCSHFIKKHNGDGDGGDDDHNAHCNAKCNKNALYYETENVLLCPTHYKKYVAKKEASNPNDSDKPRCVAVLKSGTNKGKPCNSFISIDGSQFCKRHTH